MHFQPNNSREVVRPSYYILVVALLAVFGSALEITSLAWDGTSHIMQETEEFWRIHHIAVYSGAAMVTCSAILGSRLLIKNHSNKQLLKGIKIIIIGAGFQIFAGYMDSVSHYIIGIDGKVSATHEVLEAAIILSAFGGFLVLNKINNTQTKKLIPVAIATLIFTCVALIFDLVLLLGGPIVCTPVYKLFSYGCAIL